MDVVAVITPPAQSKNEAFDKLEKPITWGEFRMLINLFGFYIQFLPLYELDIRPWRCIFSKQTQLGTLYQKEKMELKQNIWNPEEQRLLERLNKDILSGTTVSS